MPCEAPKAQGPSGVQVGGARRRWSNGGASAIADVVRRACVACVGLAWISGASALAAPQGLPAAPSDVVPGEVVPILGDRLSGFVLPIEPVTSDFSMQATQAWTWRIDDTTRFVLRGDVAISVAGNTFRATEAAVWINRLPSAGGMINQFAVYFDEVSAPTQRAGLAPNGHDILVTVSARGSIKLMAPFVEQTAPTNMPIVARGERRLADHLRRLVAPPPPPLDRLPRVDQPLPPPPQIPVPGGSPEVRPDLLPSAVQLPSSAGLNLFNPSGLVSFGGGSIDIDEKADLIKVDRGVVVDYLDEEASGGPRRLTLTAERGVLFLQPGTMAGLRAGRKQIRADKVLGIYLEGNVVAADGISVVRSRRVYYDVPKNRALLADAVMRTYDRASHMPVVARAEEMRQLSADQWTAQRANVSTSEFFTPHISIGAQEITVTRPPASAGAPGTGPVLVEAEDVTFRAGTTPFFYWPKISADTGDVPLRTVTGGFADQFGAIIQTDWDMLSLLGVQDRGTLAASLKLDGYTKRGPAAGTLLRYDFLGAGNVDLYGLHDDGVDKTSSGIEVDPATPWRGVALWEHRANLTEHWTLELQESWISDPTFITTWRPEDFARRREYETSAYVLRQQDNHALTGLMKYDLDGFISNEWLLGSRGYFVDRAPEGSYRRYGDTIFDSLTWSQEYRASRMRLIPTSGTPAQLGVPGAAFGIPNNENIRQAYLDRGYRSNAVGRLDMRQELALPFDAGPVKMMPYVVGRATDYINSDFEPYSPAAESFRWFGAAGLRASTEITHIDNSVENRAFDLHRMRHVLEPGMTAWYGYSNAPESAYPIYDQDVEGIGGATAIDFNLKSTWQTQRGGAGRWNSVDFLTMKVGAALNSSDADVLAPTPQFFDWRPEYSRWGNNAYGSGVWQVTDNFALSGTGIWLLDDDTLARGSVGVEIDQSPDLTTFIEYRTIKAENSDLLEIGWDYRLSKKYRVIVAPQIDLTTGQFRAASVAVVRDFPDFQLVFNVSYDQIQDQTTFSASLRPIKY